MKLPPHPFGWTCAQCRCWFSTGAEVYMTAQGQMIPATAEALKTGAVPLGTAKIKVGLCQLQPQWTQQVGMSYCWQFKPRLSEVTSPDLDKALDEFQNNKPPSIIK